MAEEAYESAPADPLALVTRRAGDAEDGPLAMPVAYSAAPGFFLPRDEVPRMAGVTGAWRERINRELNERLRDLVRAVLDGDLDRDGWLEACADLEVEARLRLADIYEASADAMGQAAFAGTFAVPEYVFDNDDIAAGRSTLEDLRAAVLKQGFGLRGSLAQHLGDTYDELCG